MTCRAQKMFLLLFSFTLIRSLGHVDLISEGIMYKFYIQNINTFFI